MFMESIADIRSAQGATSPSIVYIRDSAQSTLNSIALRVSNTLYSGSSLRCQPWVEMYHKNEYCIKYIKALLFVL